MKGLRLLTSVIALLTLWLPATAAHALDYRSVASSHAVMFDAPSALAKKVYILSVFTPVEIIVNLGEWVKVRDGTGELAWIESKHLTSKRIVVITAAPHAEIHESADASAPVSFKANKDVALEFIETSSNGWVKVRHRDGLTGYILATQVWGL